jgi:ribosomal protein L37AE/L43A
MVILRYQCPTCMGVLTAREGDKCVTCSICKSKIDFRFLQPFVSHIIKDTAPKKNPILAT